MTKKQNDKRQTLQVFQRTELEPNTQISGIGKGHFAGVDRQKIYKRKV